MFKILSLSAAACLLLTLAGRASAQTEPRDVLAKAVKGTGGEEKLTRLKATRVKFKGTGEFDGVTAAVTGEVVSDLPRRSRIEIQAEVDGQSVTLLFVTNGDKAWLHLLGETMELKGE